MRYLVTYRVKVEADSPEEAVRIAGYCANRGATDPENAEWARGRVEVPKGALYSTKEIVEVDGERQWAEVGASAAD
jgi:hypothetical protein